MSSTAKLVSESAPAAAPSRAAPNLIPIPEWPHPWPPQGGLRHLRFHCATNGFATAFRVVGARVLVDEAEFFRCVEKLNTAPTKVRTRRARG